jgi:hypothetical protein
MISLKAFLPQLAHIFGTTPAALYERQRALMRLGVLAALAGRGPGSGVPLTADNLAPLIIALAATDNLSDTDERVGKLCDASPLFKATCPLTGAKTFKSALAHIFGSTKIAGQVSAVFVNRNWLVGSIQYRSGRVTKHSEFHWYRSPQNAPNVAIMTQAHIDGKAIRAVAAALHSPLEEIVRSIRSVLDSPSEEVVIESAQASKIKGRRA